MKKIIKLFAISFLILSGNVFANTLNYFGFTLKQVALCTDWSCTNPFEVLNGSVEVAVNETGAVPNKGSFNINLPTSGTYSYIRLLVNNDFVMNGYGQQATNKYCATGSSTIYATEALAKAAATDMSFVYQLDKNFVGNGVDASGYGDMVYGYGTGQNNIPGYSSSWSASTVNEYTNIYRRDDGNDDLFLTTVLQGSYDFSSGKLPTTITFGITVTNTYPLIAGLATTSQYDRGRTTLTDGSCIIYPGEFLFDFVIQ